MQWIIQAFGERYGARAHATSSKPREHSPVQVTEEEVHYQLALLPVRKAVPPEAAPAALWRACVAETSPFIAREVNQQWREPELQIRQDWADANVALLPKVKARTDSPLDWRPIGLQNPVGKTLMKILVARAKDQIHQLVMQYPQTAYVPHRSTHTALKRVYQHCARVRRDPSQWISLVDKTEYLGLIISYAAFEKQSVRHRIQKANQRGKHKDWKAHLHKCTALWQCSILCAKHEEQQHDGRADGGVLWGCQEGGGLLGPMEGLCSFDARSPQSLRDAPNGKRRREPFRGNQHPQVPQQSPFQYGRLPSRDPLLTTLARAVLRQQEELRVLRQDTSFILFMKPGEDGVMNVLYKAALIDLQGQAGGGTHVAVRSTATPHGSDYDHVQGTDGSLESNAGISELRTKAGGTQTGWRFQRWNASLRQLDSSRPPIPDDRMLDHLATLIQCLKHPIITRFRCKRKLMETMTSQATFLLDISLRCHSAITMWDTMKILQNNAVFQLVGLAYKPESLGSGAQEKQIRDMAFSRT
eukprot:s1357_g3.t1